MQAIIDTIKDLADWLGSSFNWLFGDAFVSFFKDTNYVFWIVGSVFTTGFLVYYQILYSTFIYLFNIDLTQYGDRHFSILGIDAGLGTLAFANAAFPISELFDAIVIIISVRVFLWLASLIYKFWMTIPFT